MRLSQKARWGMAGGCLLLSPVLVSAMPVSGCSSSIDGRPVPSPGAGGNRAHRPHPQADAAHRPPPAARPRPRRPARPTPAGAIPLPPDDNGYVFIETKSGQTRCQINKDTVGCEAPFLNSPMQDGEHANGVSISSGGKVQWVLGNLGAIPTVAIDYKTYAAQGWTINASPDGTRFTNDQTGHGMFVSIEKVDTF